jgi:hypothetical protein
MIDVEGRWIGAYTYGSGYSVESQQTSVPFEAEFKNTLMGFVGKIFEEVEYGGLDDDIYVEGQLDLDKISFTKFYSKAHYFNEQDETISEESDDPNIVYYDGNYNYASKKFEGKWKICMVGQNENGQDVESTFTGGWEMWRPE